MQIYPINRDKFRNIHAPLFLFKKINSIDRIILVLNKVNSLISDRVHRVHIRSLI